MSVGLLDFEYVYTNVINDKPCDLYISVFLKLTGAIFGTASKVNMAHNISHAIDPIPISVF